MYKKALFLLCLLPIQILVAQTGALKNFPDGSTPDEIGNASGISFCKIQASPSCKQMDWLSGNM